MGAKSIFKNEFIIGSVLLQLAFYTHICAMQARYIVIEGNIGSGKTSLAMQLQQRYSTELLLEEFADNSFLPQFYQNPDRWAFQLELSFMADRYKQMHRMLLSLKQSPKLLVADYLFDKSLIFAQNNLSVAEMALYKKFFAIVSDNIPKPDLIVLIKNSTSQLLANIAKRGRGFEQNITAQYLDNITGGYAHYKQQNPQYNWLEINGDDYDFVNNATHFDTIVKLIEDAILNNQTQLFGPTAFG